MENFGVVYVNDFIFFSLQLTLNYQIKLKNLTEVLKRDHDFLKKMTQPNQVKEQLAQLYRELEETGEAIRPLLEADLTNSCTSSSSNYSTGEECEEFYINTQKQRQVGTTQFAAGVFNLDKKLLFILKIHFISSCISSFMHVTFCYKQSSATVEILRLKMCTH